jgi:transposase
VFRAQIVLLAATGLRNDEIAQRLGTFRETVSRWRKRYFLEGDAGLLDRPRSGRPRAFPPSGGGRDQGPRLRPAG